VPFLFDACSFVASAGLLAGLAGATHVAAASRARLRDVFGAMRASRPLQALVVTTFVGATCGGVAFTLLVLVAEERLHLGPAGFGMLVSVLACGGVVGSLIVERLPYSRRAVLSGALLVNASSYALFAFARSWVDALPPLIVWGASISAGMVASLTMRQQMADEHARGRVLAMFQVAAAAGSFLGAAGAGALVAIGGLRVPYLVIAVLQGVVGLGVWAVLANEPEPVTTN
jgi:predicted MFS family arabinose efflux permease